VPVESFLAKWEERAGDRERLAEHFDVALLAKCDACRACKDDCPVCKIDPTFQPNDIIAELLAGNVDAVIADGQLWKCLECYTCQEMCHSRIGMADVFRQLKELSTVSGSGPESVAAAYAEFLKTGALGKPRESARKKLGLEPLPQGGGDAVARLLASTASGPLSAEKE
jgi:heterodisulfide reductase subunit C